MLVFSLFREHLVGIWDPFRGLHLPLEPHSVGAAWKTVVGSRGVVGYTCLLAAVPLWVILPLPTRLLWPSSAQCLLEQIHSY